MNIEPQTKMSKQDVEDYSLALINDVKSMNLGDTLVNGHTAIPRYAMRIANQMLKYVLPNKVSNLVYHIQKALRNYTLPNSTMKAKHLAHQLNQVRTELVSNN